jgi:sulfonate transport system substrate-binding protein
MRTFLRQFAPVLVLAFGMACDAVSESAASGPQVIRIAVVAMQSGGKVSFFGPAEYVAQDSTLKSELDKRHVSIEWLPVSSAAVATLVNEGFASHRIDFAYYGDLPSIILNASGFATRLVAPGNLGNNVYLVVPPGSTAKSIADLAGKRIALHRGRPWEVSFGKLLAANGLKVGDFKIINLNPQAGASALAAGSVDAYFTLDDAFLLADKGLGKIIWSSKGAPLDWKMRAELWGTSEFVQQHPDWTQLLVTADLRAVKWISQDKNRQGYLEDLAERYGYPESVIQREYDDEGISWKEFWSPRYTPNITRHYEDVVAYARSNGLIRKDVDVDALIAPTFVDTGLKDLGLGDYWQARVVQ